MKYLLMISLFFSMGLVDSKRKSVTPHGSASWYLMHHKVGEPSFMEYDLSGKHNFNLSENWNCFVTKEIRSTKGMVKRVLVCVRKDTKLSIDVTCNKKTGNTQNTGFLNLFDHGKIHRMTLWCDYNVLKIQ